MTITVEPDALAVLLGVVPKRGRREWLRQGLRDGVRSGLLPAGARLPGSRALAATLAVSRGLVTEVVDQLVAEGYLVVRARSGAHVATGGATDGKRVNAAASDHAAVPPTAAASPRPPASPGTPDLRLFPVAAWGRAARHALASVDVRDLGYPDARGHPALREVLAGYLARTRGAVTAPEAIVVVAGAAQAFAVLALATRHAARPAHWAIEDPGSAGAAAQLRSHGVHLTGVPVDAEGLRTDRLPPDADAVLVTPAHQYPTGVLLSPARRHALLEHAATTGTWVIEDDYDADLRYDGVPVACLQGLAPARVALVGSVSKSLAPGLRLGWVVVPEPLRDAVAGVKRDLDLGCPVLDQVTLARFVDSGAYDRHLRRVRPVYRRRRAARLAELTAEGWRERDGAIAAGLHLYVERDGESGGQTRIVGFA